MGQQQNNSQKKAIFEILKNKGTKKSISG